MIEYYVLFYLTSRCIIETFLLYTVIPSLFLLSSLFCKTVRFCVDYRKLNKVTVQDPYPLPRVDDILMVVATAMLFSLLDLKQCFWQLGLHALYASKTAFSTQDGHFEFKRMPFGLKNACARMVQRVFGDIPFVQAYADDICVFSIDFDTHVQHLLQVLDRLAEANLKLNWAKCKWFQLKVQILGHVISHN